MVSVRLPNYLISNRRRLALSQEEVAFLLGQREGSSISRFESFRRMPDLEEAIALAIVYDLPIPELFAGVFSRVEREVFSRAKVLSFRVGRRKAAGVATKRRASIAALLARGAQVSK